MSVAIEVLGPLRLRVGDADQRIGGRRERVVLAVLASASGRQVTDERLVDEVWGDDPPASAIGSLQVAISRLRKVLDGRADLRRETAGYVLHGVTVTVDADTFAEAARALDAPPEQVLATTERALSMWNGTPYADLLGSPTLRAEATRLEEERLRLVEARAQALLDLGRAEDARSMLAVEVDAQPFRERMWPLLALALYRCDRQPEALETLRRLRTHLVEEWAAAEHLVTVLGLASAPTTDGPFVVVRLDNGAALCLADALGPARAVHLAFLADEPGFETVLGRLREQQITTWADPFGREPGIDEDRAEGGRALYWNDPDGNTLEILTVPDGGWPAGHHRRLG